jgi:hypothetical protein
VLKLIGERRGFFLGVGLAGLALRLFFLAYFPMVTDDSRIYSDLATNWLQHGVYGQTQGTEILPVDTRLPGYPGFLAAIFWLFGVGNFKAAMRGQILIDLGTCLIVADIARRTVSDRAARIGFLLAGLCPFLANYCVAELTETLEIFCTAAALDAAVAALGRMRGGGLGVNRLWAAAGVAIAGCILLRPDGGILLAAVLFYLTAATAYSALRSARTNRRMLREAFVAGIVVSLCALAPLVPWTLRNWRTLHRFQPLAPRYANDADELVARGFNRWVKTWMVDYVSVEEIYWNVPGDKIDPKKLPARAFDGAEGEEDAALALIADYNESQDVTPELDARFGQLADERIRAHPLRYYVALPALRVADMWLRPRTEILPPDPRWWEFNDDVKQSMAAVGLGLLNLAYVGAGLLAAVMRRGVRWWGLLVGFVILRSAFLLTIENPEPRYTLECYPAVMVGAAALVAPPRERAEEAEERC